MKIKFAFIVLLLTASACSNEKSRAPEDYLTPQEKDAFMMKIIRFTAKAPEGVNDVAKLQPAYDKYYQDKASRVKVERYFPKGDKIYFLITQPAPSLVEKRHATGGHVKLNGDGEVMAYEEVFRTWKMNPDTLITRSYFLFEKMINEEPLEPYYSNKKADQYIEFPDDRTFFDKSSQSWKTRQ